MLTPVVQTIAERLYDTCVLTSDMWARSFPDLDGQTTAWTTDATEDGFATYVDASRGYAKDADFNTTTPQAGGIMAPGENPNDCWTATPPGQ